MTTTQRQRALRAMYLGLGLTVVATAAPYIEHATNNMLADHISDSYPTYTDAQVDSAATTWLVVLSVIGVLGLAGWLFAIWAVNAAKTWAPWVATALFVVGTTIAFTVLF